MKIFITGGTGFIGTHLLPKLTSRGHQPVCLIRKASQESHLKKYGAMIIPGDVTDQPSISKGMVNCQAVIHLANVYSFWEKDREIYARINIDGTRNVMITALQLGLAKVVHISSVVIYGNASDMPVTEETAPGSKHYSEYARTKYLGDKLAWELYEKEGLPLVTVLPGAVVGPGDTKTTGDYVSRLVERRMPARVLEDAILTFVHVEDVADIIIKALEKDGNIGQKYIAGKFWHSMKEINEMTSRISGVPLPKLSLPKFGVGISAMLLTGMANLLGKPPLWGMSNDMIATMKAGFRCDGSKAERELGITYTSIEKAISEEIETLRK